MLFRDVGSPNKDRPILSSSSAVMFLKNLEGSCTHGLGPPSNNISLEEPRVTKATDGGSTVWNEWQLGINDSIHKYFDCSLQQKLPRRSYL